MRGSIVTVVTLGVGCTLVVHPEELGAGQAFAKLKKEDLASRLSYLFIFNLCTASRAKGVKYFVS